MLKHGILGLLNYGDMTGYEIMTLFRDSLNYFWSANTSQIYRELQGLSEKGFATIQIVKQEGKPDKKVFSITDSGRIELKEWLKSDDFEVKDDFPILMRTFFAGEISREANIQHFRAIRNQCIKTIESVSKADKHAAFGDEDEANVERAKYWRMTIDFGIRYAEMLSDWCEDCIKELKNKTEENV